MPVNEKHCRKKTRKKTKCYPIFFLTFDFIFKRNPPEMWYSRCLSAPITYMHTSYTFEPQQKTTTNLCRLRKMNTHFGSMYYTVYVRSPRQIDSATELTKLYIRCCVSFFEYLLYFTYSTICVWLSQFCYYGSSVMHCTSLVRQSNEFVALDFSHIDIITK